MIMEYLKNIFAFLAIAFVLNILSSSIESSFFSSFLNENVIIILVTLLAINTATSGLIISKLHELSEKNGANFDNSYNSLKNSLKEQIIIIIVCSVSLILRNSKLLETQIPFHYLIFDTIILATFIYSLDILYDTGKSIFLIVNSIRKK